MEKQLKTTFYKTRFDQDTKATVSIVGMVGFNKRN